MHSIMDLTILILCLDEAESIPHCIDEARGFLERNAIAGEVVVVDNGSKDQSVALAEKAGARVIQEPCQGYGNAIIAGIRAARGQFIILGDGDGEHDLGSLEPFWEKLRDGYDFVFGNRFREGGSIQAPMSALRRYIGNPLLSGIGRLFLHSPVGDFHCGLRGFSTEAVRMLNLRCSGMECATEMIAKAIHQDMRIAEVPIVQRAALNPNRTSRLRVWRDGWAHLYLLLILSPRPTFLYPGAIMLLLGLLLLTVPVLNPVEKGGWFGIYTMMFGSAFVICGVQTIIVALFASIFWKTLTSVDIRFLEEIRIVGWSFGVGLVLAITGMCGSVWSLFIWAEIGGAESTEIRLKIAIPSLTLLVLGVQSVFSGLFLYLLMTQRQAAADK